MLSSRRKSKIKLARQDSLQQLQVRRQVDDFRSKFENHKQWLEKQNHFDHENRKENQNSDIFMKNKSKGIKTTRQKSLDLDESSLESYFPRVHQNKYSFQAHPLICEKKHPKKRLFRAMSRQEDQPNREEISLQRKEQIQVAKQILSNNISIIWIFVLSCQLPSKHIQRIKNMYGGISSYEYVTPVFQKAELLQPFLSLSSSLFKIVTDISNAQKCLQEKSNPNVIQFYLFNEKNESGVAECIQYKSSTSKVKGIYTNLQKILEKAEDQIDTEIKIFISKANQMKKRKYLRFFPSFLQLSHKDKTQATNYRMNLLGAINLPQNDRKTNFQYFMEVVKAKYEDVQSQQKNIQQYEKINHFSDIRTHDQAAEIIKFYVKQSFYYSILNSLLRTMKSPQQFKSCILPFNQTYHAIKAFHEKKLQKLTVYRGTKLRNRDFQALQPGVFIEIFGFVSTSKSLQIAKSFTGREGYLFVIDIPQIIIPPEYEKYDHGFIDLNAHGLSDQFSLEEEVLFNALNIFQVKKIQDDEKSGMKLIYLEYGTIFELVRKKKSQLNHDEEEILVNYKHCMEMLDKIEDQGDVFLAANFFDQSKRYYLDKIDQNIDIARMLFKLANVQQKCGQLDSADLNARKSLQIQMQTVDKSDYEKRLSLVSIQQTTTQINVQREDFIEAQLLITQAIQLLSQGKQFEKAEKLRKRGEIRLKKGQIFKAEEDFYHSERILLQILEKGKQKRKYLQISYIFSYLTICCRSMTIEQLQEWKEKELSEIESMEEKIQNMKGDILEQLMTVSSSIKEVAIYCHDTAKYGRCNERIQSYLREIESYKKSDPRMQAKLKVIEATSSSEQRLSIKENLIEEAISLSEGKNEYDQQAGKYRQILASVQKNHLQQAFNPSLSSGRSISKYDQEQRELVYNKCRNNFTKAINTLQYNNKKSNCSEVVGLKNQLSEVDFNESRYDLSYDLMRQVQDETRDTQHTQVAKSCFLLAKIAYSRGELKSAFRYIDEADSILKSCLVKKQNPEYFEAYKKHHLYLQLSLYRCKIYLHQRNYDLTLQEINAMKFQFKSTEQSPLFIEVYELQGEYLAVKNQIYEFDTYFKTALNLRQKQKGVYNILNAICYCNYAKYLILFQDLSYAEKMLQKSMEIFGCFGEEHPLTWLVLYCYSMLKVQRQQHEEALIYSGKSLKIAEKRFDSTHITLSKLKLQHGKQLLECRKYEESIKCFEALEKELNNNIAFSETRISINSQTDDEKITIKNSLYFSLIQACQQLYTIDQNSIWKEKAQFYSQKFNQFRTKYTIS